MRKPLSSSMKEAEVAKDSEADRFTDGSRQRRNAGRMN
jgi:hypothetical protein